MYHEKSHVLMKEMNDVGGIFASCKLLGGDYLLLKAFDQAEKLFQECLQTAETTGDRNFLAEAYVKMGQLHRVRGELRLGADFFQKGWMANWKSGDSGTTVQAYQGLGLVSLDEKNYASAATYFRKALALYAELSGSLEVFDWLEILVCLAATLSASGQAALAAVLFGAVDSMSTKAGYQFHPPIQAIHDSWMAQARDQLDPRRFKEAWQRGLPLALEEAIQLGVEPAPQAEAPKINAAPYPGGLSAREIDVLRLVAQGMTDAQIAKELVLSPRTINSHLNSIYHKLGIKSRASATRFAVEQGLL